MPSDMLNAFAAQLPVLGFGLVVAVLALWLSARARTKRRWKMVESKGGQLVRQMNKAEMMPAVVFIAVVLGAITLMAYLGSRNWDVIFIPVASLVLASPVWLLVRRTFNQYYLEDDEHFETITRIRNKPVSMRFDEIASIEPSYNPGYIWVRSATGERVELYFNATVMPRLAQMFGHQVDAARRGPFSDERRAAPRYARLLGRSVRR